MLTAGSGPNRVPIQIRETAPGGITLAGVHKPAVKSKEEMASFLAQGSLNRATASTRMNSQSRLSLFFLVLVDLLFDYFVSYFSVHSIQHKESNRFLDTDDFIFLLVILHADVTLLTVLLKVAWFNASPCQVFQVTTLLDIIH
jgi:hypothetical protein